MKTINRRSGGIFFAAVLLASGTALSAISDHGSIGIESAVGAFPQEKPQAWSELDQLFASLSSLDAAYGAANRAQAQAELEEAKSSWSKVLPALWTSQAQAIQRLFVSLEMELKDNVAAEEVNSTIYEIIEELDDLPQR